MTPQPAYLDPRSGKTYPIDRPQGRFDTGAPLMITPLPGIGRKQIDQGTRSLWRYAAAFALRVANPVSLGEGCTPLVRHSWHGSPTLFKLEWFAPSGSFKDRGASVMISILRQQGIDSVLDDSSGNAGCAVACYAAAAGMRAKILVPAYTQPGKTVQIRAYGAEVQLIPGTRNDTTQETLRQAEQVFYASHSRQAFFLEGAKSIAYELWEDLGFTVPDNIIIPTAGGANALGCDIGFGELMRQKEVHRLPRLFLAQAENCAPIHASFTAGVDELLPIEVKPTIAEGTAVSRPARLKEVLQALRRSKGETLTVSEEQIVTAWKELAGIGLYAEPTSAVAAAALTRLLEAGTIQPKEVTVVLLTGSGLKATQRIGELLGMKP
jgi:threonine synthase